MIKGLIKVEVLNGNVFHFHFSSSAAMNRVFLRFQEYHESPKFKGQSFTLNEFKNYYKKFTNKKRFTYYTDWSGCNFPDTVVRYFSAGHFGKLTKAEESFLEYFKDAPEQFYVIASSECDDPIDLIIRHELAHAFFYLYPEYKNFVIEQLSKYDIRFISTELNIWGYCEHVMEDEINAYLATDPSELAASGIPIYSVRELVKILETKFNEYAKQIL